MKSWNFSQPNKSSRRHATILRRKEKDSRNSSLPRRTFLGRVVRRGGGGCLDAAASIRYITGAFTSPHSSPSYAASLSLPLSPSLLQLRLDLTAATARVVSPVRPLMPPLSWERLRGIPPFLFPPPFRLCNYQDSPLATPCSRRTARRCNGHCLRVKSFHPQTIVRPIAMRSGRLHDFSNFRSYTIENICDGNMLEENLVSIGRVRAIERKFVRSRFKTSFPKYLRLFERGISEMFRFIYVIKILKSSC